MVLREEELPMVALANMNDTHLEDLIMINGLSALIADKNIDETTKNLEMLVEHTKKHFATEEQMMLEKGFPPYPMHKAEHE